VFTFEWEVFLGGYEWRNQVLVPHFDGPGGVKYSHPLQEHSGLFRTLASTPPTPEGILQFAHRYGLLWYSPNDKYRADPDFLPELREWVAHIWALRICVTLWDAVRTGDQEVLARYLHWSDAVPATRSRPFFESGFWLDTHPVSTCEERQTPGHYGRMGDVLVQEWNDWDCCHVHSDTTPQELHVREYLDPTQLGLYGSLDLFYVARIYLCRVLERRLAGKFSPRMLAPPPQEFMRFVFEPDSLLSAAWLQFAVAIDGDKEHRQCQRQACGKWFELSPEVNRADKLFCSDVCRMRAYRQRQATARDLSAKGVPLEDIARALATKEVTVQGWVRQKHNALRGGGKDGLRHPATQHEHSEPLL
jgi:hypothetical protein